MKMTLLVLLMTAGLLVATGCETMHQRGLRTGRGAWVSTDYRAHKVLEIAVKQLPRGGGVVTKYDDGGLMYNDTENWSNALYVEEGEDGRVWIHVNGFSDAEARQILRRIQSEFR